MTNGDLDINTTRLKLTVRELIWVVGGFLSLFIAVSGWGWATRETQQEILFSQKMTSLEWQLNNQLVDQRLKAIEQRVASQEHAVGINTAYVISVRDRVTLAGIRLPPLPPTMTIDRED